MTCRSVIIRPVSGFALEWIEIYYNLKRFPQFRVSGFALEWIEIPKPNGAG